MLSGDSKREYCSAPYCTLALSWFEVVTVKEILMFTLTVLRRFVVCLSHFHYLYENSVRAASKEETVVDRAMYSMSIANGLHVLLCCSDVSI